MKKKYVQVGVGGRSEMFWHSTAVRFKEDCELLGICDNNAGRLVRCAGKLKELGVEVKTYAAESFDRMIAECTPDTVIVTTRDCHHHEYICRAMELGCDVITEKPMTTDADKCQQILATEKQTGRKCTVSFNYRYAPPHTQLKDMLMSGIIGNVISVDFHWMLNTRHGADYFRRWHRNKENSGGLMVHKATHHFDLVNWWLSTVPERVFAMGNRNYYVPETAERYGLKNRGERCHGCPESANCPFFMDMAGNEGLTDLYLDQEEYDGYLRDRCVFSPDIDIEDTMNVMVDYRSGATLSYSLNAFAPWEGFTVTFNGSRGRIEHVHEETVYVNGDGKVPGELVKEGTRTKVFPHFEHVHEETVYVNGDGKVPGELVKEGTRTKVFPHFLPAYEVDVWTGEGGHGGGDKVLLEDLFLPNRTADKYMRAADHRAGAWSIVTGIAANRSFESKQPVEIKDLLPELAEPDYPDMPQPFEPIPSADLAAIKTERENRAARDAEKND